MLETSGNQVLVSRPEQSGFFRKLRHRRHLAPFDRFLQRAARKHPEFVQIQPGNTRLFTDVTDILDQDFLCLSRQSVKQIDHDRGTRIGKLVQGRPRLLSGSQPAELFAQLRIGCLKPDGKPVCAGRNPCLPLLCRKTGISAFNRHLGIR